MIIVHTSDLHLGSALSARLGGEKLRQRRAELRDTFMNIVEETTLRGARFVIIAGDLFDTVRVSQRLKEEVISIIRGASELDFLYLPGNHEKLALLDGSVALPENLKVFGEEWTYYDYGFVTVAGKSRLGRDLFDGLVLDADRKNIVVLHGALAERSGDGTVGLKDASERGIDYLALGHYHSFSKTPIDTRGVAVYSGTPEGRGFDEVGKCGISLIDTDGVNLSVKFLPTAKREHVICRVDISNAKDRIDIDNAVKAAISDIEERNIVRVVLTGKHLPELCADTESLRNRYSDSFYHLEVIDESGIEIDPESYRYDKSLKGEFIRLVLDKSDLSESERDMIIKIGLGALMGDIGEI